MTEQKQKRVLIYDETGFSRICSALLERYGFRTDVMTEELSALHRPEVGVFVTSYPYGARQLDEARKRNIPAIVLFDDVDGRFFDFYNGDADLYCMLKPIDYEKFKILVRQLIDGGTAAREDHVTL